MSLLFSCFQLSLRMLWSLYIALGTSSVPAAGHCDEFGGSMFSLGRVSSVMFSFLRWMYLHLDSSQVCLNSFVFILLHLAA